MNLQSKSNKKTKVAVALSGGVDSATAAFFLKSEGYDVFGITIRSPDPLNIENQASDIRTITEGLGIKSLVLDLSKEFNAFVIEPFCQEYLSGRTPNPCVECNRYIKFGILLQKAEEYGAEYLATGHYAKLLQNKGNGLFEIRKGDDPGKDQSYFLWRLQQEQLKKIILPLGGYSKKEIKKIISDILPFLPGRPESQEICFIPDKDYGTFISGKISQKNIPGRGPAIDENGDILGTHRGYIYYTIGQRRGIGISHPTPLFVKRIIPETNALVLAEEHSIYKDSFYIKEISFVSGKAPSEKFKSSVKIRYNSAERPAEVRIIEDRSALIKLEQKVKAVTPGQSAVFFDGDLLLGGGIISD